jgi:hypothetical protein
VAFSQLQKRAKLRLAYEVYAPRASLSLLAWLTQECARLDALMPGGQTIASATGNGSSVAFSDPLRGGSPVDMIELWEEIRGLYDIAKADLIAAGTASPTEAEIVADLLANGFPDVRVVSHDFSRVKEHCLGGCV